MDNIIQVEDLKKDYGNIQAVRGISFQVERGSLFAFLGPNGAGKSTTIEMMCTFLPASSGKLPSMGKEWASKMKGFEKRLVLFFKTMS